METQFILDLDLKCFQKNYIYIPAGNFSQNADFQA
jgi:hypothetical protein